MEFKWRQYCGSAIGFSVVENSPQRNRTAPMYTRLKSTNTGTGARKVVVLLVQKVLFVDWLLRVMDGGVGIFEGGTRGFSCEQDTGILAMTNIAESA